MDSRHSLITRGGLRVVIGLGKTGLSVIHHLNQQGYSIIAMDTRNDPPGIAELPAHIPQHLGSLDVDILCRAEEIIVSPGLALSTPEIQQALAHGVRVVGDIELLCRATDKPIIAITGSNAKSTVTTLIGMMAQNCGLCVAVGGNLGTPALELLALQANLYVLELSSFQLETTHSLQAAVAVVLNVSEDHMDRYDSMLAYYQAKHRIFKGCHSYVINRDDALTRPLIADNIPKTSFGLTHANLEDFGISTSETGELWLTQGVRRLMLVNELLIKGRHNTSNALAALALGFRMGFPMEKMLDTLREFKGLPHRCQFVATHAGISYFNDSKGTNVGATLAAIQGLGEVLASEQHQLVLLLGGDGKGQDFSPLAPAINRYVRSVICYGADQKMIAQTLTDQNVTAHIIYADHFDDAFYTAKTQAITGDSVLLSPACASFDMFKNYEHRGDCFVQLVQQLAS